MKRIFLVIIICFAVLPLFIESRFWLGFWTTTLFFALLGQSWNILGGYGGQGSFGHAPFFGPGAHVSAGLQGRFGIGAWASAAPGVGGGGGGGGPPPARRVPPLPRGGGLS